MTETVRLHLVDVFADRPFEGNPAGVILDADGLSDEQMQVVAGESNVSETAFVVGAGDLHRPARVRWFTPTAEVGFCGHATLAAAHALTEAEGMERLAAKTSAPMVFETAAGMLRLRPELLPDSPDAPIWWLGMPAPGLRPDDTNPVRTCELLGLAEHDLASAVPIVRTRDDDLILVTKRWQTLADMRPDFSELAYWSERNNIRGYCVATLETLNSSINVHSRFFAPRIGIDEDPVTGSVHGPLAALLVSHDLVPHAAQRVALTCRQGRPGGRTGTVRALVESTPKGYHVFVGGTCWTTLRGELRRPPAG